MKQISRRCFAVITLLCGLRLSSVLAQTAPKLLFSPMAPTGNLKEDSTKMIEDLFISELIQGAAFELTTQVRTVVAYNDTAAAVKLANESKVDFILLSSLSGDEKPGADPNYTLVARLVAADTGQEVFSMKKDLSGKKTAATLQDLSKRLAVAVRSRKDVTIELVDAFIKKSDWEAARRFMDIYLALHEAERAKQAAKSKRINTGLAAVKYNQSREAAALTLYDEAIRAAKEAVALEPGAKEYKVYLETLETEYASYVAQSDTQRLDAIQKFFDEGRLDVAKTLLARSGEAARTSARGRNLSERIERSLKARAAAAEAEKNLREYKYPLALAFVDEALRLLPDTVAYIKLRTSIIEAEKHDAANQARIAAYRAELDTFDFSSLYLTHKAPLTGWEITIGGATTTCTQPGSTEWQTITSGPFPELGLRFSVPIPLKLPRFSSISGLSLAGFGDTAFSSGVARSNSTALGTTLLIDKSTTQLALGGGVSAILDVLSFAFRVDARLGLGVMLQSIKTMDTSIQKEEALTNNIFTLGGGLGWTLQWVPFKGFAIMVGYMSTMPLLSTLPASRGAPTVSTFSAGVTFAGPKW